MHEVSIAESIVELASEYAVREMVRIFSSIDLEIGKLAGIEIDALRFAMEVVCQDTVLDGAQVRIKIVDGRVRCDNCGFEFSVEDFFTPCPVCGGSRSSVISGEELRVTSLHISE